MQAQYKKISSVLALLSIDAFFFSLVNPQQTHTFLIVVGFGLVIVTLYVAIGLLLAMAERIVPFSVRTRQRLNDGLTMLLAVLLAMQSIGQLTSKDFLAIVPFVAVAAFYLSYQRKDPAA